MLTCTCTYLPVLGTRVTRRNALKVHSWPWNYKIFGGVLQLGQIDGVVSFEKWLYGN